MRVLLAEDEKELSDALAAILKHANYSVDAVFDGADALDYALAQEYDALILDIMMPKLGRPCRFEKTTSAGAKCTGFIFDSQIPVAGYY